MATATTAVKPTSTPQKQQQQQRSSSTPRVGRHMHTYPSPALATRARYTSRMAITPTRARPHHHVQEGLLPQHPRTSTRVGGGLRPHHHQERRDPPPSTPSPRHAAAVVATPATNGGVPFGGGGVAGNATVIHEDYGETVCDYDKGPTALYELLESSKWEKARARCKSHPGEVRTWIVRKDRSLKVRWKLLPLHAAIIFQSPYHIIAVLLEQYPEASLRKDDQGMLPLHLAFRHKPDDEELLELLLEHNPKAINVRDKRERVPLDHGRDGKYSAKLVRIFADAAAAGSAQGGRYQCDSPTTKTTQASTAYWTNSTQQHMAQTKAEHESRIALLKSEFDEECKALKRAQEGRLSAMEEEHKRILTKRRDEAEHERQQILQRHQQEMDEMRDLLTSQMGQDRMLRDALEEEVANLHDDLTEARIKADHERSKYTRVKSHMQEVYNLLSRVNRDHVEIQNMLVQQQEDLDTAREVRRQLIETLLNQDESEGSNERVRGSKMIEVVNKARQKIGLALDERLPSNVDDNDGASRIERDRLDQDMQRNTKLQEEPFDVARDAGKEQNRAQSPYVVVEAESTTRDDNVPVVEGEVTENGYGFEVISPRTEDDDGYPMSSAVRKRRTDEDIMAAKLKRNGNTQNKGTSSLADEISAITDNSF